MSYDIYIGEAVVADVDPSEDDGDDHAYELKSRVNEVEVPDAPTFPNDDMTGKSNGRHPGYSQWANFCDEAGLWALFSDVEDGLMREHPGCFLLRPAHLVAVRKALKKWKKEHPRAVPGFGDREEFERGLRMSKKGTEHHERQRALLEKMPTWGWDAVLARLIWLEFWFSWALKNCKVPAVYNS